MINYLRAAVPTPVAVAACLSGWAIATPATALPQAAETEPLAYTVDLTDRSDDTFKVQLAVDDLGPENAVYQFASTAP